MSALWWGSHTAGQFDMPSKTCKTCQEVKSLSDFTTGKARCKPCLAEQARIARADGSTANRDARKRYYANHTAKISAAGKINHEQNRDARLAYGAVFRENNRALCSQLTRDWQQRNPERGRENTRRRRALKLGSMVEKVSYKVILERDGLWCYLCETVVQSNDVHFDHVIPLSKGGAHSLDNIRVTHSRCNLSKGNRLVADA